MPIDSVFDPILAPLNRYADEKPEIPLEQITVPLDRLEGAVTARQFELIDDAVDDIVRRAGPLIQSGNLAGIQALETSIGLALQNPILFAWDQAYQLGGQDGIAEMRAIAPDLPINWSTPNLLNTPAAEAVVDRSLTLAGKFSASILDDVKVALIDAIIPATGRDRPLSRKELREEIMKILQVAETRAEAIARTESTAAYNRGRLSTYREVPAVTHVRFLAIADLRTTEICRSRNGLVIPIEQAALYTPPLHVRSVLGSTEIETIDGSKKISNVTPGDYVLTHKGKYKRVYAAFKVKSPQSILRVEFTEGKILFISHEHPVLTSSGYTRADLLKVGDKCFQYFNESNKIGMSSRSFVPEAVLTDSANRPPIGAKEKIAANVFEFSAFMASSVKLDSNFIFREREVNNIATNGVLEFVIDIPTIQEANKKSFMDGRISRVFGSNCSRPFFSCSAKHGGVCLSHSFGMHHCMRMGFFCVPVEPVIFPGLGLTPSSSNVFKNLLRFSPHLNPVLFGKAVKASISKPHLSFNETKGLPSLDVLFSDDFSCFDDIHKCSANIFSVTTVKSIVALSNTEDLYNLSVVDDESYVANGIVLSNCRSVLSPVMPAYSDRHRDYLEDEQRRPENRVLSPLPEGWTLA